MTDGRRPSVSGMKLTEFEKKRAANLIWNGAGDYSVAPGFRVYDEEGRAELYWNSIVGSIHRHYDWEKLLTYYHTFHETADQGLYESLFWIAMENAAFGLEENERPVFPYLRREYARRVLKTSTPGLEISRADWIFRGHLHHAMGEDSGLPDLVDRKLLEAIEIGPCGRFPPRMASIAQRISVTPALSSAPRSVMPSVVMSVHPARAFRCGKFAAVIVLPLEPRATSPPL